MTPAETIRRVPAVPLLSAPLGFLESLPRHGDPVGPDRPRGAPAARPDDVGGAE